MRRAEEVRNNIKGLVRLSAIMGATVGLIILEPDLGATVVITLTMLGVFFLAGAPGFSSVSLLLLYWVHLLLRLLWNLIVYNV